MVILGCGRWLRYLPCWINYNSGSTTSWCFPTTFFSSTSYHSLSLAMGFTDWASSVENPNLDLFSLIFTIYENNRIKRSEKIYITNSQLESSHSIKKESDILMKSYSLSKKCTDVCVLFHNILLIFSRTMKSTNLGLQYQLFHHQNSSCLTSILTIWW